MQKYNCIITGAPAPDRAADARLFVFRPFDQYKAVYGFIEEVTEFTSCRGSSIQTFPEVSAGMLAAVTLEFDGNRSFEDLIVLRSVLGRNSKELIIRLDVLTYDGTQYTLSATEWVETVAYNTASNIYLFRSGPEGTLYLVVDGARSGSYTGSDSLYARVFEVGKNAITRLYDREAVYGVFMNDVDLAGDLAALNVPFAKNCASFGSTSGSGELFPLCDVGHTISSANDDGSIWGYFDMIHTLRITSAR